MCRNVTWSLCLGFCLCVPGAVCEAADIAAITRPSEDVTLSFVMPGRIAKVLVKEGDEVKAGQLLVQQDDAAELVQLEQLKAEAEDTVRTFSRGMAQRLALARMLLHRPRLLLLDEPHASLDARGATLLDDELATATADGRSAIIVTHEVERVARVADRLMVLRAGRVVLDEPTAGLDPMAVRRRYEEVAG